MQALCVSVILAEHSFRDNPRNTQCSNATEIDCSTVKRGGPGTFPHVSDVKGRKG